MGVPPGRIRRVYNAPDPGFRRAAIGPTRAEEHRRILERYQIEYPFLLYAGNIRRAQKHPAAGGGLRGGARAAGGSSRVQRPAPGDHRRYHFAVSRRCARR